jgi:hypothetical protein
MSRSSRTALEHSSRPQKEASRSLNTPWSIGAQKPPWPLAPRSHKPRSRRAAGGLPRECLPFGFRRFDGSRSRSLGDDVKHRTAKVFADRCNGPKPNPNLVETANERAGQSRIPELNSRGNGTRRTTVASRKELVIAVGRSLARTAGRGFGLTLPNPRQSAAPSTSGGGWRTQVPWAIPTTESPKAKLHYELIASPTAN